MTSECYETICDSDHIGYVDTPETSFKDLKTSEPYNTIGDTDISVYVGLITEELFEAIDETVCIDYLDTLKASNVNTETSECDHTIGKTNETSYNMVVDIVFGRTVGRRCGDQPVITSRGGVKVHPPCPRPCIKDIQHPSDVGSSCASHK